MTICDHLFCHLDLSNVSFAMTPDFFPGTCLAKCRPQCSFTKYNFDMTSTRFPVPGYHQYQKAIEQNNPNVTYDYMRENYAEVTISFDTLIVFHTNMRAKYEIFSASSAMGGIFGMLLGGSMLALYELAEISILVLKSIFNGAIDRIQKNFKISPKISPN